MDLLQIKIFLANRLPTHALIRIAKLYHTVLKRASRLPFIRQSQSGLTVRVAQRSLADSDLAALQAPEHVKLKEWDEAFREYEPSPGNAPIPLTWVHKPVGGNYGDWLSPYLIHRTSGRAITHQDLFSERSQAHLISLGSIISAANRSSLVLGSGINSSRDEINPHARYILVRGFHTLEALPRSARHSEIQCCDPGFFLREIYKPRNLSDKPPEKLLIPHINHARLFRSIGDPEFTIASANVCKSVDLEALIDRITAAELVVTSAMHIFVTCCTYGIKCALIKPETAEHAVPGDGIKYRDCMSPVLSEPFAPKQVRISKGMSILNEVDVKLFDINFKHISNSYEIFRSSLQDI
ncbi:hypothetical protein [Tsuneonella suprasediminis]|uniref:hypothetical protein n=1 Tax=Tsuneonella suprasediminis TaxID=2306996 RepID=UPI002F931BC1